MLRLDAGQGNVFVILLGQDVSVSDTIDTTLSILISVGGSLVVPLQGKINVLGRMNTELVKQGGCNAKKELDQIHILGKPIHKQMPS
ncbi:hypothetical protein KCV07_g470, partial [Aureobasidium melanogenum]